MTLWPNGLTDDSVTWELECEPAGGDHPDPAGACAALERYRNPFAKLPKTPRCDEIPGATAEVARIVGTFRGRKILEQFDRSNGCVFERWDRLAPVFGTDS